MKKNEMIIAAFENPTHARNALRTLRDEGFSHDEVGIITHGKDGSEEFKSLKDLESHKTGKGAAVGAVAGGGGGALWALGIAAGILPAIGPVIAGGLLAALAASAASGAAAGGVVGALVGTGISDEDAAYYSKELERGRTLVVVRSKKDERIVRAMNVLQDNRAYFRQAA